MNPKATAPAPSVVALILAGGYGLRLDAHLPKQYIEVKGESVLHHTLRAFAGKVGNAVVVCRDEWRDYVLTHGHPHFPQLRTAQAGTTGFDSLRNGIASLADLPGDTLIMIHDAVRPLISAEIIADNLRVARECGNAIAAIETYETLLHAPDGGSTVRGFTRREGIFRAQTPHTFTLSTLRQMMATAQERCIVDAQSACTLASQLGYELHLSKGDLRNFKITTPSDLDLYEILVP
ncbi:MAG: 2-C-methyl-D-erythritol 4-phosphate cytidylyltransferase [Bacteroidaceae bacterium]|nr:2-C-methyl-D-erythritol 4-phosphate cytidylyltransferase [Bacteroidaceae bacterium]